MLILDTAEDKVGQNTTGLLLVASDTSVSVRAACRCISRDDWTIINEHRLIARRLKLLCHVIIVWHGYCIQSSSYQSLLTPLSLSHSKSSFLRVLVAYNRHGSTYLFTTAKPSSEELVPSPLLFESTLRRFRLLC